MSLSRLLRPASIAVIGGQEAGAVLRQCRRMGYGGRLFAVNPHRRTLQDLPCVPSVRDLPEPPDAAFVAVPGDSAIDVVAELAERGAGGAVCYASGFAEVGGEGWARQEALIDGAGDMPVIGPNCYGFLNYLDGAPLWPDQHGGARCERGVAILSQSGNMGINFSMQQRGLPLAYLFSLGNQAKVGMSEIILALLDDARVSAIGLHIEGLDDTIAFDRVARAARKQAIPLVALKTGRSATGADLALSHTASLGGEDRVFDALLNRLGIARVHSLGAFLETLKLLHCHGPLPGNDVVSMSCSGGEASLIADTAEAFAVRFPAFSPAVAERIRASVHPLVSVSNPFDYHTFDWADEPRLAETFEAVLAAQSDLTMLVLDFPRADRCEDADWWIAVDALAAARDAYESISDGSVPRAAILATLPDCMPEWVAHSIMARDIAPLAGIDEALAAVAAAAFIGDAQRADCPAPLIAQTLIGGPDRLLDEQQSKSVLAKHGLQVPENRRCEAAGEAVAAAEALGYPVAVKVLGGGIAHKSDVGGVCLNLWDAQAVRNAVASVSGEGEAILVERMIGDAVLELFIGVARDPVVGPYLVVGAGGTLVELLDDSQVLTLPLARADVERAISNLRCAPLLDGFRGGPRADREAVLDAVEAVGRYAIEQRASLLELDINPLLVRPEGHGAVVADALIRLKTGENP